MRTKTSLQGIRFGFFTIVILLAFFVAGARSVNAQCPHPKAVKNAAGECVFTTDQTLDATLILPSNTTLNCQFHSLQARRPGKSTAANERSFPEVAIFLNGAQNVVIKNCTFDKFDFGVFAVNSKRNPDSPPSIQILNNIIVARFVGISLMSVDDTEIRGNQVTSIITGGRGLYVGRNSDRNIILNNTIRVDITPDPNDPNLNSTQTAVRAPGPAGASNPLVGPLSANAKEGSAILIAQTEGPEPTLLNAIVEGVLYQLPVGNTAAPEDFSEDNIFEGNAVTLVGTIPVDGVVLASSQGTRVSKNRVVGAKNSIRVGLQTGTKQFHGTCTNLDSQLHPHFCFENGECNVSGVNLGACQILPPQAISWVSHKTIIQDNEVTLRQNTPIAVGIATSGEDTVITGNNIRGVVQTGSPLTGFGIRLAGKFALATTIVTRNRVKNIAFALDLIHNVPGQSAVLASAFNARISVNDFTNYGKAVKLSPGYTFFTELSAFTENSPIARGNFWDEVCPIGLKPSAVDPENPRIVTDIHPFGRLVVDTFLLAPCF